MCLVPGGWHGEELLYCISSLTLCSEVPQNLASEHKNIGCLTVSESQEPRSGLAGAEDLLPSSIPWLLARGLSSLLTDGQRTPFLAMGLSTDFLRMLITAPPIASDPRKCTPQDRSLSFYNHTLEVPAYHFVVF